MILDDLDEEIRELNRKLHEAQSLRDNIANDKLTVYVERKDDRDPWPNPFPWAFENDIIMTVDERTLRVPLDDSIGPKTTYIVYRFKHEEDAMAFRLKWL